MRDRRTFTHESQGQAKALASLVAQSVQEFFQNASNRVEFERWYEGKYGEPYHWKSIRMEE